MVLGLVSLILMTAVLAGGTAPPGSSGTRATRWCAGAAKHADDDAHHHAGGAPAGAAVDGLGHCSARLDHPAHRRSVPGDHHRAQTAAPAPTAADCDSDCGGQPTVSVDGQLWQCTFDDEFNGTTLDTSKWAVQQTADGGYHSGVECFEDSPNNVSVSGGTLNLTAAQAPRRSSAQADPPYYTQYTSGMVSTDQQFNQTDGLFEVRAKISGADDPGLQTSFWLYPAQLTYGAVADSGEIDIAELFSQYPTLAIPFVHYNNSANDPEDTNDTLRDRRSERVPHLRRRMDAAVADLPLRRSDVPRRPLERGLAARRSSALQRAVLHLPDPGPRHRDERLHAQERPRCPPRRPSTGSGCGACRS